MFGNIPQYFSEKVIPDFIAYVKQRKNNKSGFSKDVSTGINSAISLYHFREHLKNFSDEWDKSYNDLLEICPNYSLLGEVVNASKHAIRNKPDRKLTNAENIFEEIIITIYEDKKGEFNHVQKEVIIKLDSGEEIILFNILTEVINMWIDELQHIGLFHSLSKFNITPKRLPRRSKNSGKLDLITTKQFYGRRFRIQKYNYKTKMVEPPEHPLSEVKMNIYKKIYPVTLNIKPNDGSKEIELNVDLSEKQIKKINQIKDENLKLKEVLLIAEEQGLITITNNDNKKPPTKK